MNNNFDDFLKYLKDNENEFNSYFNLKQKFEFPTNQIEFQSYMSEIVKLNKDITINLLRMYHTWNSQK